MKKRILLIDDEPLILESCTQFLELANYEVITASSGNQAIEKIKSSSDFDVIVTDYQMTDGTGSDVIQHVTSKKIDIPIILVTAHCSKELLLQLIKDRIFGFLEKPFSFNDYLAFIDKAIKNKEQRDYVATQTQKGIIALTALEQIKSPLSFIEKEIGRLKRKSSKIQDEKALHTLKEIEDYSKKILDSLKQQDESIENLQMSKNSKVKIQDIFTKIEQALLGQAVKYKVPLIVCPTSLEYVTDPDKMFKTLSNLVDDSLHLVSGLESENRWVKVEAKLVGPSLQIIVSDGFGKKAEKAISQTVAVKAVMREAKCLLLRLNSTVNLLKNHGADFQFEKEIKDVKVILNYHIAS